MKNDKYFRKLLKLNRLPQVEDLTEDQLSAIENIKDYKDSLFVLSNKWFITTDEVSNPVVRKYLIDMGYFYDNGNDWTVGNHYGIEKHPDGHISKYGYMYFADVDTRFKGFQRLTFEQFKKYVLKK